MPRGRGGGRRVRQAGKPLSKNLTFRLDTELDRQLRKAATESGRSVSEEIQYRLRQSFKPGTNFQVEADYKAVAASYQFMLAQGAITTKDHPELGPLYEQMKANWEAIKGEEKK
jgi:hypothetical protein